MSRPIAAFFLAPLLPALIFGVLSGNVAMVLYATAFSYPATMIFGLPAYFLFRRLNWFRFWQVVLGGACLGLLASLLFSFLLEPGRIPPLSGILFISGFFVVGAVVAATTFWLIVYGKPSSNI